MKDIRGDLPATIACQVMRKYSRSKTIKEVKRVNLVVPGQAIRYIVETRTIYVVPLKLELKNNTAYQFSKINQIELDSECAYVTVTIEEDIEIHPERYLGVDRNTTGHIAVVSCPETGKVYKFGKNALHVRKKYMNIRRNLSKDKNKKELRAVSNRESRIIRDVNHKVSRAIVNLAREQKAAIVLENLKGIRDRTNRNRSKSLKHTVNSWSFFQLQLFLEYKSKLHGIPIRYVSPEFTSQECSRCGNLGNRYRKEFKCPHCGHVDHSDSNAAFNIANRHKRMVNCT